MCGLVGIAGELEFKDEAAMKRLLILDYFRGTDSTGLARFAKNGSDFGIAKLASHPIDLFDSKKFATLLSGSSSQVFLGHNRAATLGKVNGLNAHPFHFGKIIGAHNGTLDKDSWDRLMEASGVETDVDSAAIFACIDKIGIEETVKLMEEGRDAKKGAWALTWINMEDGTMNFLRNQHRPLTYAWSKDFRKLLWASEWPMMDAATEMSKTDYTLYTNDKGHTFFEFSENFLYTIPLAELRKAGKDAPYKFKVKKLEGRQPKPYTSLYNGSHTQGGTSSNSNGTAPFRGPTSMDQQGTGSTGTKKKSTHGSSTSQGDDFPSNVDVAGSDLYPYGGYLDASDFREMAKHGCSFCSADIAYGEKGVTILEREDAILCPDCSGPSSDGAIRIFCDPVSYETALTRNNVTMRM